MENHHARSILSARKMLFLVLTMLVSCLVGSVSFAQDALTLSVEQTLDLPMTSNDSIFLIPDAMAEPLPMNLVMTPLHIQQDDQGGSTAPRALSKKVSTTSLATTIDSLLDIATKRLPLHGWEFVFFSLLVFYKRIFSMIKSFLILAFVGTFLVAFLAKNTALLEDLKKQGKDLFREVVSSSISEHVDRLKGGMESPELKRTKDLVNKLHMEE